MDSMESIKVSMADLAESFTVQMADFQSRINQSEISNPTISSVAAEFNGFKTFILKALEGLQTQVALLAQQMDGLEMQSRRKILLFHGVSEADGEDTSVRVIDILKKHLKSDLAVKDIARSHRMGRLQNNLNRCILVKFRELSHRDKIWYSKTGLKGSGVTVSEFLTKPRHDVFMAARERFGVRSCFTRSGSIYVLVDGARRCISSLADVKRIPVPIAQTSERSSESESGGAEPGGAAPGVAEAVAGPSHNRGKRAKRQATKTRV